MTYNDVPSDEAGITRRRFLGRMSAVSLATIGAQGIYELLDEMGSEADPRCGRSHRASA